MPNIKRLVDLEREKEKNREKNQENTSSAGLGGTNVKAINLDTNRHRGIGTPS